MVSSYLVRNDSQLHWSLFLEEIQQSWMLIAFSLLDILSQVFIWVDVEDCRVWMASKQGTFSVASFFSAISGGSSQTSPLFRLWKKKVWSRDIALGGCLCGGILNMDNLLGRKKILVITCPMCLANEETDHLLLNCKVAQGLW